MIKGLLFALSTVAIASCGSTMSDDEVDRLENDMRATAEAQGLIVREIDLRGVSTGRAVGEATVALRDDPSRGSQWDCSADRVAGARIQWRCAPPGRQPAPPGPAPLVGGRDALAGRWTDTGDCGVVTELGQDGTFVAPNGAQGTWDFQGSQLTFSGANGSVTLNVVFDDPNTLTVTTPDGTTSRSTRC